MRFKKTERVLKLLHLGIVGLVCLASCITENDIAEEVIPDGENVQLGINTRSFNNGTDEQINTVRIIQVSRTIAQSVKSNRFINNPTDPLKVGGLTGNYDIYVIANESNDGNRLATLDGVKNLSELKTVVLPYKVSSRSQTNIPMFGEVENVTIGLPVNGNPSSANLGKVKVGNKDMGSTLPVLLTRLAVRIDLTVKSKSFSDIASVNFTGLPDGISLFGNEYETSTIKQTVNVDGSSFTDVTPASNGYITEKKKNAIIVPSYLFLPQTDKNKAASVEVFLDGKSVPFKAQIGHAVLSSVADSDKDYTLHPNTQYTLNALIAGDELTIDTQVRNWDKNEADYPAGGGSFWRAQPKDTRVGLGETTTIYAEFGGNGTGSTFKWFRRKQLSDFTFSVEEISAANIKNTDYTDYIRSELSVAGNSLDDACEVYCVASIIAPDGNLDRLESEYATFMVVGDWTQPTGTYPSIQNWKAPLNVPHGSTCLLQDDRDNKVYRVKLMADDNWWMVQDLAFGKVSTENDFMNNCAVQDVTNLIGDGLYGVCMSSSKSTGGYLYNAYAALQFKGILTDSSDGDDVKKEYLPSLCPEGWHLPGNVNGEYNKEWTVLINKTTVDLSTEKDIAKFIYNDPNSFNAYTPEPDYNLTITFHGGYRAGKSGRTSPIDYLTLGIATGEFGAILMELGERNENYLKIPIRCLRNFK